MHQRKYALELIADLELPGSRSVHAPMEVNQKLTTLEYGQHIGITNDPALVDAERYQILVRRLLYLTKTRSDISFIV